MKFIVYKVKKTSISTLAVDRVVVIRSIVACVYSEAEALELIASRLRNYTMTSVLHRDEDDANCQWGIDEVSENNGYR